MLDIQRNRLDYGKLLAPPDNFELVKAIGTTYSLDLHALLAIPVSLFYAKSMEGDFQLDRYDVLDAIRQSKERVDLFCQRGKIKVPKDYHSLFAFMEDCVNEKVPEKKNASFHPKIWVLRFEHKAEVIYRFIVLSRNLTFDRSWDVAYYCEGQPSQRKIPESAKLSAFIKRLYSESKKEIASGFLTDLSKTEFDLPFDFSDFEIHPILPKSSNTPYTNPVEGFDYSELLVISPFVNKTAIEAVKKHNRNITLVSRKEELDRLEPGALDGITPWCMKDVIANGEDYTDTEGVEPKSHNLHAKLFIGEKNKRTDWYMGSANFTSAALANNTEMLVKITSTKRQLRLAEIKNRLLNSDPCYFEPYTRSEVAIDDEMESLEEEIRTLTYSLCKLQITGNIVEGQNENKTVFIEIDLTQIKSDQIKVYASLPHRVEAQELVIGQKNKLTFVNVPITKLSKYLELNFYYDKTVQSKILVKIEIEIPSEREDIIFKTLINSKDKFYQYLQFILSPKDLHNTLVIPSENGEANAENENLVLQNLFGINNPIYEALMMAASRSPKKLAEINKIIEKLQKIDSEVVEDFLPIWDVFKEFAHD
jgi:HKD family nuclease